MEKLQTLIALAPTIALMACGGGSDGGAPPELPSGLIPGTYYCEQEVLTDDPITAVFDSREAIELKPGKVEVYDEVDLRLEQWVVFNCSLIFI